MDVPGEWDEQDACPRPVGLAAAAPAATGSSETKMYTRDFLLNLQKRPQCQELPPGFERDPQLLRSEPAVSWLPPQGMLGAYDKGLRCRSTGLKQMLWTEAAGDAMPSLCLLNTVSIRACNIVLCPQSLGGPAAPKSHLKLISLVTVCTAGSIWCHGLVLRGGTPCAGAEG